MNAHCSQDVVKKKRQRRWRQEGFSMVTGRYFGKIKARLQKQNRMPTIGNYPGDGNANQKVNSWIVLFKFMK